MTTEVFLRDCSPAHLILRPQCGRREDAVSILEPFGLKAHSQGEKENVIIILIVYVIEHKSSTSGNRKLIASLHSAA